MYGRRRANDFLIPAAADDQRVYVNVFGVEMAFDAMTGKLLWRSGKLHLLQLQQQRQGVMPERYSIMVAQGRTWSVLRDPQQANQGVGFSLMVRDAATGKEVFNTRRSLSAWNILSSPCLVEPTGAVVDSAPAPTVPEPAAPSVAVNYPNGFAGAADNFKFNGTAQLDGDRLRLTDGGARQAASVYAATPLSVAAFRTQFTLRMPAAPLSADGFTFTIQGQGPTALGANDNGLGYAGIGKSVAVKFDLLGPNFKNDGNTTGLYVNGEQPTNAGAIKLTDTGVDLHSGHDMLVEMTYDGAILNVTITDTVTKANNKQSYAVNIPETVGGNTAYVGFTGATGQLRSKLSVVNWTYCAAVPPKASPAEPFVISAPVINFPNGFAGAGDQLKLNGASARLDGDQLQLTDGKAKQAASVFTAAPVNVAAFRTQFTLRLLPAKPLTADGMTFTIQGVGPTALGANDNGLGYAGIGKSVAVKFDLLAARPKKWEANMTGLYLNGSSPMDVGSISLNPSGVDLHNGHDMLVSMNYDGANLQVTITDAVTKASHTQSYGVNIPETVGGNTAYVGFTASTGWLTSKLSVVNWTFAPTTPPKVDLSAGSVVYLGAGRTGRGREMSILALNAKDGKLVKTIAIGSHAVDQNQVYGDRIALASFLMHHGRLYVDTHAGALVAIQPQTGALEWGILYDSPPPLQGYYYNYEPPPMGISGPLSAAGLLFTKGMRSSRLLGVQAEGPALAWKRPVSRSAVILAADDERLYMGGEELTAYSLKTQELLWAAQLPHTADWSVPLVTKNRLYQFTSRGICELDKRTGEILKIFRGHDLDSLGGSLLVTPHALITVSNLAITAYPRGPAAQ